jgi:hypothetical protein
VGKGVLTLVSRGGAEPAAGDETGREKSEAVGGRGGEEGEGAGGGGESGHLQGCGDEESSVSARPSGVCGFGFARAGGYRDGVWGGAVEVVLCCRASCPVRDVSVGSDNSDKPC